MILEKIGLSVWVADSEGRPLPEYKVKAIDDGKVECWIPSTQGANFKIQWKAQGNPHPGLDLRCKPWLDGVELGGWVQHSPRVADGEMGEGSNQSTGPSEARLFEFGKRELTDKEDGVQSNNVLLDNLNTIRVELRWGRGGTFTPRTTASNIKEVGPIHERAAKKGHSGSVQLGKTISIQAYTCTFDNEPDIKPGIFVFRYASRDWLQAREIIPCSPKPECSLKLKGSPKPESPGCRNTQKRAHSSSPEIIDIDDLETDDDEIVFVKHMVPAPSNSPNKKRKLKDEDAQEL